MAGLPTCNTLWIGERLSAVERACLRSALRQGHPVTLYCYDKVEGVPEDVEVADAAAVLPRERIVRYRSGSVSLFSNHFRYALQAREAGLWMDTDHYCLKPHNFDDAHLYGLQANGRIATGVLRLPKDSPVLRALLGLFEGRTFPVWAQPEDQDIARRQLEQDGHIDWTDLGWGLTGPLALTYLLQANLLDRLAKPPSVFCAAPVTEARWILDPARDLEEFLKPDTVGIHLWNEKIKGFKHEPAPKGSFLARLQEEGA